MTMKKSDIIYDIIKINGGRTHLEKIRKHLSLVYEENPHLISNASVSSTIKSDNLSRANKGLNPRFRTYKMGEQRGYVSIISYSENLLNEQ